MKIVVSIGHPAHVHLFRNFIFEMRKRGHEVIITATEKEITFNLLENYGFDYIDLGSYGHSLIQKLINLPIIVLKMYNKVKSFNPDLFVGVGAISAAHVSFLLRKKCIILEDTEHSTEQIKLYLPFANVICTPACFRGDLGKKQVRYNGYHELAYLHPNYFTPNPEVLKELHLKEDEVFTVLRFVSWNATHDVGHHGIQNKVEFVEKLEKYSRILITSEGTLDDRLEKYRIKVLPEKLHDLLHYATLYVGDGGTTAAESAILGTPSIYVSSLVGTMGNFIELEEKYGLLLNYYDTDKALKKAIELVKDLNVKNDWRKKRQQLIDDKIDVTSFIVEFTENYMINGGYYELK